MHKHAAPSPTTHHQALTLLVLAAGMGSRYGGLKQMERVGSSGETVMDYAIFDAWRAGFSRVVFVIRHEFADLFRTQIGQRYAKMMAVDYALQDLHDLPAGYTLQPMRTRPWGTAHAVLAARHVLDSPFAVVNADDFYGAPAYAKALALLRSDIATSDIAASNIASLSSTTARCAMVAYPLGNTLSPHGGVNRGICQVQGDMLTTVSEYTNIAIDSDGICRGQPLHGQRIALDLQSLCSMNFWCFTPAILPLMEACFANFLSHSGHSTSAECYIPSVVDTLMQQHLLTCRMVTHDGAWFGITYAPDRALCVESIAKLVAQGHYPQTLWPPAA